MHTIHDGRRVRRLPLLDAGWRMPLLAVIAIGVAACGDSTSVETLANPDEPTEALLNDFLDQEVREASAFDVVSSSAVRLDSNSRWDFIFQILGDGTAQLKPRGAVIEEVSDAGLIKLDVTFEEVRSAPDRGYQLLRAMAIEEGDILAVRSQRDASFQGLRCRRYGKLEVLTIDKQAGTMTFNHLINPNCENRNLVPGAAVPIEDQ